MHEILPVVPKVNRKEPIACDFEAHKGRNPIERMFGHLKRFGRIATRYDKTALSFIALPCLAAAKRITAFLRVQCRSILLQDVPGPRLGTCGAGRGAHPRANA